MNMFKSAVVLIAFMTLTHQEAATAHHAYTVLFDVSKRVALTGTLRKVDWRNPHIEISLDAKADGDGAETWVIEAAPPIWFSRNKVTRSEFEKWIGQAVTVEVYRARDGNLLGSLLKITFPDGKSVKSDPMA